MTILFCLTTLSTNSSISAIAYTRFRLTTNFSASNVGLIYRNMGKFINRPSLHERMTEMCVLMLVYFNCDFIKDGLNLSYVTADGQSASLSWNKAVIWGLRPDLC
jgi:hypothetical protein